MRSASKDIVGNPGTRGGCASDTLGRLLLVPWKQCALSCSGGLEQYSQQSPDSTGMCSLNHMNWSSNLALCEHSLVGWHYQQLCRKSCEGDCTGGRGKAQALDRSGGTSDVGMPKPLANGLQWAFGKRDLNKGCNLEADVDSPPAWGLPPCGPWSQEGQETRSVPGMAGEKCSGITHLGNSWWLVHL